MEIELEDVWKDSTSCNFCQKGELNKFGNSLIYPYKKVINFKRENGNGLCACICEECLEELYKKGKSKFENES